MKADHPVERHKRTALNEQIYEQAAEWFLAFRDGESSAGIRSDFDLWVRRSPEHLAAHLELDAIWNEAPSLRMPDKAVLTARALRETGNVVPFGQPVVLSSGPAQSRVHRGSSAMRSFKAAAILAVAIAVVAPVWWLNRSVYAAGIGEQRTIALDDGSRVELNSRSRLRIRYSQRERNIELLEGQALFTVAKDPNRPFVVDSGNARVRAVGTRFDVYRKRTGTVVTVVEGQVAIRDRPESPGRSGPGAPESGLQAVLVSAGQQLLVTRSEVKKPVVANVENVTAWTQQQLSFDAASLSEVAEEFNRYNERQLVIRDGGAFDFRISGVFSSSDLTGLVRFLRDRPGIRVLESPSQVVVEKNPYPD